MCDPCEKAIHPPPRGHDPQAEHHCSRISVRKQPSQCQQDGWAGEGTCCEPCQPESDLWDRHDGMKDQIP